jgi:hypothetical protein
MTGSANLAKNVKLSHPKRSLLKGLNRVALNPIRTVDRRGFLLMIGVRLEVGRKAALMQPFQQRSFRMR